MHITHLALVFVSIITNMVIGDLFWIFPQACLFGCLLLKTHTSSVLIFFPINQKLCVTIDDAHFDHTAQMYWLEDPCI